MSSISSKSILVLEIDQIPESKVNILFWSNLGTWNDFSYILGCVRSLSGAFLWMLVVFARTKNISFSKFRDVLG